MLPGPQEDDRGTRRRDRGERSTALRVAIQLRHDHAADVHRPRKGPRLVVARLGSCFPPEFVSPQCDMPNLARSAPWPGEPQCVTFF